MLFTTIPLARAQSTSQVYKDHNIENAAPGTVSDVRISILSTAYNALVTWYLSIIGYVVACYYTERPVELGKTTNIMGNRISSGLFSPPQLVVSFPTKVSEETAAKLADMGFIIQTKGNYRYYKGPASEANVTSLVTLGAHADAYAEYGTCNVNGYLAFLAMDSIISGLLVFLGNVRQMAENLNKQKEIEKKILYTDDWEGKTLITSRDSLPEKGRGVLFPYFAGLVLPDKAMPVKFILDKFHRVLGSRPTEMIRNCGILQEGWSSLATSTPGCAISHLVYGISLAMDAGVNIQAVYLNGTYSGYLLWSPSEVNDFALLHGKTVVKPSSMEEIADELDMLNKHDTALAAIASILSGVELRETVKETVKDSDGKDTEVDVKIRDCPVGSLNTPRKLYRAICLRKVTGESMKKIQENVLKLEYLQKFWEISDQTKVALAATLICKGEQPALDTPMAYKTSALYNPDPIASVLSAFGPVAPSLIGHETGNAIINLSVDGKMYERTKGYDLRGIPLFAVSLQRAVDDWNNVLKTGLIRFKQSGNDRSGQAKVAGKYSIITKGSKPHGTLITALQSAARKIAEKSKKRKTEDEKPEEDPHKDEIRLAKKAKKDDAALALLEPETGMEIDTEEGF